MVQFFLFQTVFVSLASGGGGGVGTWVNYCVVCALASQSPYPIIVYFVANCRPHLIHFWADM